MDDFAKQNKGKIYRKLMRAGYSDQVARAVIGNLMVESELNPAASGDSGSAIGIAQWRLDRRKALEKKENWQDIDVQIDFLIEELNGKYKHALDAMANAESLEEAVAAFQTKYEIPDNNKANYPKRAAEASFNPANVYISKEDAEADRGMYDAYKAGKEAIYKHYEDSGTPRHKAHDERDVKLKALNEQFAKTGLSMSFNHFFKEEKVNAQKDLMQNFKDPNGRTMNHAIHRAVTENKVIKGTDQVTNIRWTWKDGAQWDYENEYFIDGSVFENWTKKEIEDLGFKKLGLTNSYYIPASKGFGFGDGTETLEAIKKYDEALSKNRGNKGSTFFTESGHLRMSADGKIYDPATNGSILEFKDTGQAEFDAAYKPPVVDNDKVNEINDKLVDPEKKGEETTPEGDGSATEAKVEKEVKKEPVDEKEFQAFIDSIGQEEIIDKTKFSYDKDNFKREIPVGAIGQAMLAYTGMKQSDIEIPERKNNVDPAILAYLAEAKRISQMGLDPAKVAEAKENIASAMQVSIDNAKRAANGNRNLVLSAANTADINRYKAIAEIEKLNIGEQNKAFEQYGKTLQYLDSQKKAVEKENYDTKKRQALRSQQEGKNLANASFGAMMNELQYHKENAPGSANHMLKSMMAYEAFGMIPGMDDNGQPGSKSYKDKMDAERIASTEARNKTIAKKWEYANKMKGWTKEQRAQYLKDNGAFSLETQADYEGIDAYAKTLSKETSETQGDSPGIAVGEEQLYKKANRFGIVTPTTIHDADSFSTAKENFRATNQGFGWDAKELSQMMPSEFNRHQMLYGDSDIRVQRMGKDRFGRTIADASFVNKDGSYTSLPKAAEEAGIDADYYPTFGQPLPKTMVPLLNADTYPRNEYLPTYERTLNKKY